ncbi:MAG: proton extrusion protein PcxA [Microcoleaceae cyanobacterium]
MTSITWRSLKSLFRYGNQWFRQTPERALDQAYDAALKIRSIENEHFNSQPISTETSDFGDRVNNYFKSELKQSLNIIKTRLAEFNTSRSVFGFSDSLNGTEINDQINLEKLDQTDLKTSENFSICYEKLSFIDSVISPYQPTIRKRSKQSKALVKVPEPTKFSILSQSDSEQYNSMSQNYNDPGVPTSENNFKEELTEGSDTSFLPRSLLRTFGRIRRELNPESEDEVLKKYRKSKVKTIISIRFVLLLILIPLLTQQLSKNFIVGPIVDSVWHQEESQEIFFNLDMEEEAFMELHRYQERLEFQKMIGILPNITDEEIEEEVKHKAQELATEYQTLGSDAIKNVFADILSVITFGVIIYTNRKEVDILKSFMGDLIYGLSDSAKAFIIILLTDMFVGFHSPHGWEVILESIARHFGLPENRDFNFLFIATFPVILDAVFKYWIFRYLNRSSPSAVSTYKTMNE